MEGFTSVLGFEVLVGVEYCGISGLATLRTTVSGRKSTTSGGRQVVLTEHGKMAKNRQFQANEIVGVDPILGCLPNESALIPPGR